MHRQATARTIQVWWMQTPLHRQTSTQTHRHTRISPYAHSGCLLTSCSCFFGAARLFHSSSHRASPHVSSASPSSSDPYHVLGVSRSASKDEIKRAYYQLAKEHHPDTNSGSHTAQMKATQQFHRIQAAYEILSDDTKKQQFDVYGHCDVSMDSSNRGEGEEETDEYEFDFSSSPFSHFGFGRRTARQATYSQQQEEEMINDFFREWTPTSRRSRSSASSSSLRGSDLQSSLTLTWEEAAMGCNKTASYQVNIECAACDNTGKLTPGNKKVVCSTCSGRGFQTVSIGQTGRKRNRMSEVFEMRVECEDCNGAGRVSPPCPVCSGSGVVKQQREIEVKIPAGVNESTNVRLQGLGDAGRRGGKPGNLKIMMHLASNTEEERGWRRDGADVHEDVTLHLSTAIKGTTQTRHTLRGETTLNIPAGVCHGHQIVLPGKGIKLLNTDPPRYGSHIIHIHVKMPDAQHMTQEQIEMIEQIQQQAEEQAAQQHIRDKHRQESSNNNNSADKQDNAHKTREKRRTKRQQQSAV